MSALLAKAMEKRRSKLIVQPPSLHSVDALAAPLGQNGPSNNVHYGISFYMTSASRGFSDCLPVFSSAD